jgi:hypothetical protein
MSEIHIPFVMPLDYIAVEILELVPLRHITIDEERPWSISLLGM